jgi:hypothetical protein
LPLAGNRTSRVSARSADASTTATSPISVGDSLPYPSDSEAPSPGLTDTMGAKMRSIMPDDFAPARSSTFVRAKPWQPLRIESTDSSPAVDRARRSTGRTACSFVARSTTLMRASTTCATKARVPSSDTTMLRGSRGTFTSNFGAKVFASNAPIACAQPEVTRTVASSGVAASAMGSARVSMTHRSASGSVSRAAGSRTSTAFEERSVTATRPSAKTSTCSGRPFSGVPAIS